MTIDEQLVYLEGNIKDDIDTMSAKDRANYYQTLHEFTRPKQQRSQTRTGAAMPTKIELVLVK